MLVCYFPWVYSYTIVQNGRGLVGVMNESFSITLNGVTASFPGVPNAYLYLQAYPRYANCSALQPYIMEIDGVKGIKLNQEKTLMLVPEITFSDLRTYGLGLSQKSLVTGIFNGYGSNTNENLGEEDSSCLWTPLQSTPDAFLSHKITATGRVLIYGTGQQTSSTLLSNGFLEYPLLLMLISPRTGEMKYEEIIKSGSYPILVSDLGCTLTTPTLIDFGPQPANSSAGQLLATKSDGNLSINCQQNTNPISATLSLSAGINPLYYSSNEYEVNLLNSENKAGAYVTMSIDINGTATNIPFNRNFIDIGSINENNSMAAFSYPITYSLYSRGTGITGKVKGSAELSIVLR